MNVVVKILLRERRPKYFAVASICVDVSYVQMNNNRETTNDLCGWENV